MNCQRCQRRILDALAAGMAMLPREVTAHQLGCEACQAYYESEASLFRSLEEGLKAMANDAVPPSLVPRVRARLDEESEARYSWMPGWGIAAIAALILAVSLGSVLHRSKRQVVVPENVPVASRRAENPVSAAQSPRIAATPSLNRGHECRRTSAVAAKGFEAIPEVIVLPEERAAFAKFVAPLPEEPNVVLVLTRAAPIYEDWSLEIAAVEITELEVKALDPGWE